MHWLVDDPEVYNAYLSRLEKASGISISGYDDLLMALKNRHDFFAVNGCSISDHGLEELYADDFSEAQVKRVFDAARSGKTPDREGARAFKSAVLLALAEWDWEKGWVQQYHLGALRNNNTRKWRELGPDTGWDSIGDFPRPGPYRASWTNWIRGTTWQRPSCTTSTHPTTP